jgi:hypothetical protein
MLSQAVNRLVGIQTAGMGSIVRTRPTVRTSLNVRIGKDIVTTAAVSHSGPVHMRPEPGQ